MTDLERYLFDLSGYLVIEDALTASELAEMNRRFDEFDLWEQRGPAQVNGDSIERRFEGTIEAWDIFGWGGIFRRIILNPRVMPYVEELVGESFRVDQANAIVMKPGAGGAGLHGGGTEDWPAAHYVVRGGKIKSGMIVVSYALCDIAPGKGGLGVVPGSHKSEFPPPSGTSAMDTPPSWVVHVPMQAGSAVIFTEALRHGTLRWQGPHERRSLFYRYIPGNMAWLDKYPEPVAEDSPAVRRALNRPYFADENGLRTKVLNGAKQ